MSLISVHILEGNIARLAVVRGFFEFCFWFLFDVDCWGRRNGRCLFLLGLVGRVDETCVSHDVAAVCGGVGAAAASVHALAPHRWAWGGRLTTVLFENACDVALLLQVSRLLVVEVHAYMGAHASQRVSPVPADGTAERLDSGVGVHVTLGGGCCRRHHIATRAFPSTLGARSRSRNLRNASRRSRLPLSAIK